MTASYFGLLVGLGWIAALFPQADSLAAQPGRQAAAAESEEPLPNDPAVQGILATKPTTAVECARAAQLLADLHRPDLAKQFLQKVLDRSIRAKSNLPIWLRHRA